MTTDEDRKALLVTATLELSRIEAIEDPEERKREARELFRTVSALKAVALKAISQHGYETKEERTKLQVELVETVIQDIQGAVRDIHAIRMQLVTMQNTEG